MFNHVNTIGFLDGIRIADGTDKLKTVFNETVQKNKDMAVYFINDARLSFNTLFVLMPEIESFKLYKDLNQRNTITLKMCAKIIKNKKQDPAISDLPSENSEMTHSALRWMLITGSKDDGYDNQFDKILDGTVSLLIITYKDKTVLPIVADMIFKRNRKGLLIHDLVWAFFQSKDPYTLKIVANYLRSAEEKDVQLARQLLNINLPEDITAASFDPQKEYTDYLAWLDTNYPFLYFTGESFQMTGSPVPFRINLEAKVAKTGLGRDENDSYRQ